SGISTRETTTPTRRGSRASWAMRIASSSWRRAATRTARFTSAIALSVHVLAHRDHLGLALGEDRVLLGLGGARDLLEHRIAHRRVAADDRDPEDRTLVRVLIGHLGDRDVEPRAHAISELPHDAALLFKRARRGDVEGETKDADEHLELL